MTGRAANPTAAPQAAAASIQVASFIAEPMKTFSRLCCACVAATLLAGSAAGSAQRGAVAAPNPMRASAWEIGPITPRRNYSVNMPRTPSPHRAGWFFEFPWPDKSAGHVHYVTFRHGPLAGKRRIVLRYRIEAAPGVRFVPTNSPGYPSIISLFFQRRGDNWSGRGEYEAYRWWSTFRIHMPITPGEHVLSVGLNENWTAVRTSSAATNPQGFQEALRNADRVGIAFGGGDGFGHGVYATGPARFVVTGFRVL